MKRLNAKYRFILVAVVFFAFVGLAWHGRISRGRYGARLTQCVYNMKMAIAQFQIIKYEDNPENPMDYWNSPSMKKVLRGCAGLGAGKSPYLFIPDGIKDGSYPFITERIYNHYQLELDLFFIQKMKNQVGVCAAYNNGLARWLDTKKAEELIERVKQNKIPVYDIDGKLTEIDAFDPTAPEIMHWRIVPGMEKELCLAIAILFFIVLRLWSSSKKDKKERLAEERNE